MEQLSAKIRYVDVTNENNDNKIWEWFLGFTFTDDSSGKGLTDVISKFLEENKFEWNTAQNKGIAMQPKWRAEIVVNKREY
jgi:hypothetical protein